MSDPYSDPARQLSKLISSIRRQWQEELGEPEATATEAAMTSAHKLLNAIDNKNLSATLGGATVEQFIGRDWIDDNPWAKPYVTRIATLLNQIDLTQGDIATASPNQSTIR